MQPHRIQLLQTEPHAMTNPKLRSSLPLGVLLTAGVVLAGCGGGVGLARNDADLVLSRQLLDAPNPAEPGSFRVQTLYYGSGTDKRRAEFRDSITLKTETVDASKLVDLGDQAKSRNSYWGFEPKEFPINGRVWYPQGPGPFPLALIVHGNHNMREFSDPGYGYLGEHLASRGFILASVDMNFVNGGIRGENDARGWLLLKHLQAWREFNRAEGNPFYGKLDMDNIAVMGHSRGGEAVGHAAAFNRLSHYPDDANLTFDFGFGIRAVIAIAPVDGQYLPTGRYVPVENVNYLVFHGSHDGDVTSFHGLRQYHRVRFTDGSPWFKAAVYVYRANHGQWNTVWGSHDNGRRSGRILDLDALLDAKDQRQFGKIYITAFLEATLRDDKRYLPIFRDHRVIGGWLPKTMYITRFQESSFQVVADFEEDIDVTTGSVSGVTLRGDSLATWREGRLALRSRNRPTTSNSQNNQAVWLGWNNRVAGEDTTKLGKPASYTLELPASLARDWNLDENATLDFLLAPTKDTPKPRSAGRDSSDAGGQERESNRRRDRQTDDEEKPPIDLSIELVDANGVSASVRLGRYGPVRRPLEISILRRKDIERNRFDRNYEVVLQTYSVLLADFVEASPQLDVTRPNAIRFVFDRSHAGEVIIDNVGFSTMDPAFTRVSGAGGR
jgi:dienelactone hydrolase